jgi:hypothetical protein
MAEYDQSFFFPSLCQRVCDNVGDGLKYIGENFDIFNDSLFTSHKVTEAINGNKGIFVSDLHVFKNGKRISGFMLIQNGLTKRLTYFMPEEMNIQIKKTHTRKKIHKYPEVGKPIFIQCDPVFAIRLVWETLRGRQADNTDMIDWKKNYNQFILSEELNDEWEAIYENTEYNRYNLNSCVMTYLRYVSTISQHACFLAFYVLHQQDPNKPSDRVFYSSCDIRYLKLLHDHVLSPDIKYVMFFVTHLNHQNLCIIDRRKRILTIYLFEPNGKAQNGHEEFASCFGKYIGSIFPMCTFKAQQEVCEIGPQIVSGGGTCQLWCAWLARKILLEKEFDPANLDNCVFEMKTNKNCTMKSREELDLIIDELKMITCFQADALNPEHYTCEGREKVDKIKNIDNDMRATIIKCLGLNYLLPYTQEQLKLGENLYVTISNEISKIVDTDDYKRVKKLSWIGDVSRQATGALLELDDEYVEMWLKDVPFLVSDFQSSPPYRSYFPDFHPIIMSKDNDVKQAKRYGRHRRGFYRALKDCPRLERVSRLHQAIDRWGLKPVTMHLKTHSNGAPHSSIRRMIQGDLIAVTALTKRHRLAEPP